MLNNEKKKARRRTHGKIKPKRLHTNWDQIFSGVVSSTGWFSTVL